MGFTTHLPENLDALLRAEAKLLGITKVGLIAALLADRYKIEYPIALNTGAPHGATGAGAHLVSVEGTHRVIDACAPVPNFSSVLQLAAQHGSLLDE